jgi:hypothetical protein
MRWSRRLNGFRAPLVWLGKKRFRMRARMGLGILRLGIRVGLGILSMGNLRLGILSMGLGKLGIRGILSMKLRIRIKIGIL